ncbi:hypothetical protein [Leptotrichia trevisanii]
MIAPIFFTLSIALDWIVNITDITDKVIEMRNRIQNGTFSESVLPQEKKYIV